MYHIMAVASQHLRVRESEEVAAAVREAVQCLDRGGIVVFPTETVYGVGARVDRPAAVQRLRELKGRPGEPFTLHIGQKAEVDRLVLRVPGVARRLMRKAWPGPLTLILESDGPADQTLKSRLGDEGVATMYHQGTIGLRFPDEPVAAAILRAVDGPVVAASANRAGEAPPADGAHAAREMDGLADLILDGGSTRYSKASTIVRVRGREVEVLREGVYDEGTVRRMATLRLLFVCTGNTCRSPMAAGLAKSLIAERLGCSVADLPGRGVEVTSAGTAGGSGAVAEHAVRVMSNRGVDVSTHVSSPLLAEQVRSADYILAMTRAHRDAIVGIEPSAEDRVLLLMGDRDVEDPIGGSEADYEACARLIEEGLRQRLEEIEP